MLNLKHRVKFETEWRRQSAQCPQRIPAGKEPLKVTGWEAGCFTKRGWTLCEGYLWPLCGL